MLGYISENIFEALSRLRATFFLVAAIGKFELEILFLHLSAHLRVGEVVKCRKQNVDKQKCRQKNVDKKMSIDKMSTGKMSTMQNVDV